MESLATHPSFTMDACIVCDGKLAPQVDEQLIQKAALQDRLQKVMDAEMPVDPVMCSSCQFDLSQIEMYYKLMDIFRQRFWETASRRGFERKALVSKNVLQEAAKDSMKDIQYVLANSFAGNEKAGDEQANVGEASKIEHRQELPLADIKLEVFNESGSTTQNGGENLEPTGPKTVSVGTDPIEIEAAESTSSNLAAGYASMLNKRKRGRPRKNEVRPLPRKVGRPMKTALGGTVSSLLRKRGRPKKVVGSLQKKVKLNPDISADNDTSINNESDNVKLSDVKEEPVEAEEIPSDNNDNFDNIDDDSDFMEEEEEEKPAPRRKYKSKKRVKGGRSGRPRAAPLKEPVPCPICGKLFEKRTRLNIHMKYHSEVRPEICAICNKGFKTPGALNSHMKIHDESMYKYVCDICGKKFLRERHLLRHQPTHSDVKMHTCPDCGKGFKTEEHMRTHIKQHHVQGRKYLCTKCGAGFYTQNALNVHMGTHLEERERPFKCSYCGKGFPHKATAVAHEEIHKEEERKKFLCPICGKALTSAQYLKYHMVGHTGDAKHQCTVCNRKFATKGMVARHMMQHTGETPLRCKTCGKGFRQHGNLRVHEMSHNDERPFKCACGAAFRQKGKLERHWQTKKHAEYEQKLDPNNPHVGHSAHVSPRKVVISEPALPQPLPPQIIPAVPMNIEQANLTPARIGMVAIDNGVPQYQNDALYLGLYGHPPMQ